VSEGTCFAGLGVHARKTAVAAVQLGSGEVFRAGLPGSYAAAIEWLVCLPGDDPASAGDHTKTDQRAALKLARLLAAGQLRPVAVRHRISKMLLRCGLVYPGPAEPGG
jgi:hypothetical protein